LIVDVSKRKRGKGENEGEGKRTLEGEEKGGEEKEKRG